MNKDFNNVITFLIENLAYITLAKYNNELLHRLLNGKASFEITGRVCKIKPEHSTASDVIDQLARLCNASKSKEGKNIILTIPASTEEYRNSLCSDVERYRERAKISARSIRAKLRKHSSTENVDQQTKQCEQRIDELCNQKIKTLLTI